MKGMDFRVTTDAISEQFGKTCFLCGSARVSKTRNRRPVNFHGVRYFYQCEECNGFSLWPILESWEIQSLYSTNYIKDVSPDSPVDPESNMTRFSRLNQFLLDVERRNEKKFLDFGCGASAEVVLLAKGLGFQSFGVEVASETRREANQASQCEIYSPEELATLHQKFDFVFLGDVLEHVSNPISILANVSEILSPKGILIVQGPLEGAPTLVNSLLAMKSKYLTKSPSTFPPYHVSLATQDSIMRMLKSQQLDLVQLEITEPLWPADKLGTKASMASLSRFLLSVAKLVDMTFHKFKNTHGTRFFLIATKF